MATEFVTVSVGATFKTYFAYATIIFVCAMKDFAYATERTPHEMIGNWFPVKMAEIEVCCSSDDSEKKFSWHQLSKMILNQSKRHLKMHTCSRNP